MRIKQLLIAVCVGTMLSACSSREDYNFGGDRLPVKINASIKGMKTRSTDETQIQNTAFVDGAMINVYAEHPQGGSDAPAPGLPESGWAVFTLHDTSWGTTTPFTDLGDRKLDVIALYPSRDASDNLITMSTTTFQVQHDQTLDDDYRKSDLMLASGGFSDTTNPINLEFEHFFSKITVILLESEDYSISDLKTNITDVKVSADLKATVNIGWSGIEVTETSYSAPGEISLNASNEKLCSTGVSCIIPPQNVTGDFITIYDKNKKSFTYNAPAEGFTFAPKHEYIFKLKLHKTDVELDQVTIDGWTSDPDDQKTGDAE